MKIIITKTIPSYSIYSGDIIDAIIREDGFYQVDKNEQCIKGLELMSI